MNPHRGSRRQTGSGEPLLDEAENASTRRVDRLLHTPLAVVVQSGSAAGKSTLTDAVLSLMPEEHRLSVSAVTGQSLFYLGKTQLAHKVLAVAEAEGAARRLLRAQAVAVRR